MNDVVKKACEILKNGGIGIFPTDTAFGIGCLVDDEDAIERLFDVRKRPVTQATPVLVESVGMAKEYFEDIPEDVESLMKKFWPGALTIVFTCRSGKVPRLVRGGTETIGLRMPNHPIALDLIHGVGKPILGPSANFHGDPTPYEFEALDPKLGKLVDFVLPGECSIKQASTVIDCTVTPWKILRQGQVTLS